MKKFAAHAPVRASGKAVTMLAAMCLLALPASPLPAQSTGNGPATTQTAGAGLQGTVADIKGGLIPDATVKVRNEANGHSVTVTTDSQGHFTVPSVHAGSYTVEATAPNFMLATRSGVTVSDDQPGKVALTLQVAGATYEVSVDANATGSIAARLAPMDALLDAHSARTEIMADFVDNFTATTSDYAEIIQMAPGTFSVNSNGVGLGDSKTYFRGFADGNYDVTFDGIPYEDTNSPTHHS